MNLPRPAAVVIVLASSLMSCAPVQTTGPSSEPEPRTSRIEVPGGDDEERRESLAAMLRAAAGATPTDEQAGDEAMGDSAPGPDGSIARACMNLVARLVMAERLAPTAASRIYAYTALALYEASRGSEPALPPMLDRLTDGPSVPPPPPGLDWNVAAAAAISTVAKAMLTSDDSLAALDSELQAVLGDTSRPGVVAALMYGAVVGEIVLDWAETDGYATTRDLTYEVPHLEGQWMPTSDAGPHEPYWGELRPYALVDADACAPPPPPAHSMNEDSTFWKQVQEVYDVSQSLTDESRAIALFWADNPGQSYTPPGHWISIVGITTGDLDVGLGETAQTYALTAVAMADAFISTWSEKYRSNLIRPISVIQNHIDPEWESLVTTPPFPEYTSGHSVASGAAAEVLTRLLGDVEFEDTTHYAQDLPPRTFNSFGEAAEEAAMSRLYGGIHFRAAIEEGLTQGECVGRSALSLLGDGGPSDD